MYFYTEGCAGCQIIISSYLPEWEVAVITVSAIVAILILILVVAIVINLKVEPIYPAHLETNDHFRINHCFTVPCFAFAMLAFTLALGPIIPSNELKKENIFISS